MEIGPGKGYLTEHLIKKDVFYLGVEIDIRMSPILNKFISKKTTFLYEDFLNIDLNKILSNYNYDNLHVVGNLPYYITTKIITKIMKEGLKFETMTIMVQKEVGARFLASPRTKNYGYYTVLLANYYDIKKIVDVSKNSFKPTPKVDSVVLQFRKINDDSSFDDNYDKFLKKIFQNKRKTLKNNLSKEEFEKITKILIKHNLNLNVRAEETPSFIIKELYFENRKYRDII